LRERLKQRLVGGAVLVSLVVIFVPMLLEQPIDTERVFQGDRIPPRPPEPVMRHENGDILPGLMPPEDRSPEVGGAPAVVDDPTSEPPIYKQEGRIERAVPSAWMIQVASFRKRANAEALVSRLRKADLPGTLKKATVDGKRVYRVQVGPEVDKKLAEQMAAKIKKRFKLRVSLRRYSGG
jgi:DedD protein